MDTNTDNTDNNTSGLWAVSIWDGEGDTPATRREMEDIAARLGWKLDGIEPGGVALMAVDAETEAQLADVGWFGLEAIDMRTGRALDVEIDAGEAR